MSNGLGLATILGCLDAGEKLVSLHPENWEVGGESHWSRIFVNLQNGWRSGLSHFDEKSLRSFATNVHADVLKKMTEWRMRLDPVPDGGLGAIYMISQLREMLLWINAGKRVDDRKEWPEFVLKDNVSFYRWSSTDIPIVCVEVQGGDKIYLCNWGDDQSVSGMNLYETILLIEKAMSPQIDYGFGYKGVQIPCVSADIQSDISWLLGLRNDNYFISYAQQKILFGMNEKGFAVREESSITMRLTAFIPPLEPKPYILSPDGESFLFWRRRAGVPFPVSMFQFTKDDFKDPGDLTKIVE